MANSLPEGVDRTSLRDLSHRVGHLPAALVSTPLLAQSSRWCSTTGPARQGPSTRGAPAQPPNEPTHSYAATVGGTSDVDKAASDVLAAKNNYRRKKNHTASTSATKLAAATNEAIR